MSVSYLSLDSASEQNFRARAGNTAVLSLDVLDPDTDADYDFTGATLALTVRKSKDDYNYLFRLTSGSGLVVTTGNIEITFSASNMTLAEGIYFYDLQITLSTGAVYTWLIGKLEISSKVN